MTTVMGHEEWEETPTGAGTPPDARLRHDLRQSLAVVRVLVSGGTADPADALRRLQLVEREVDWMAELLSPEHSGDRDGGLVTVVDLGEVVSDTWRSVAATASCDVRLLREWGVEVMADPVELRRSVGNLVDNAVRAAGAGGRVDLRVRSAGGRAVLEVTDDGPGFGRIPRQEGLGLLTVRLFAAEVRGSLEVSRPPSGGTRMTLTVPRRLPAPAARVSRA